MDGEFHGENPIRIGWFGGISPTIFGNIQPPKTTHQNIHPTSTSAVSLADGTASLEPYETTTMSTMSTQQKSVH